jgi:hypothetical protein
MERYKHLVASKDYKVVVSMDKAKSSKNRKKFVLDLLRYNWKEDAWNGPYLVSATTFKSIPLFSK